MSRAVEQVRHAHRRRRPRKLDGRELAVIVHSCVVQQRFVQSPPPRVQRGRKIQVPRPQHPRKQPAICLVPEPVHLRLLRARFRLRSLRKRRSRLRWRLRFRWSCRRLCRRFLLPERAAARHQHPARHACRPRQSSKSRSPRNHEAAILHRFPSPLSPPVLIEQHWLPRASLPSRAQVLPRLCR